MIAVRAIVLFLVLIEAGWMSFDGIRGIVTGSFVTPQSGPYAGQVGPWRFLIRPLGLDPNGTVMHWLFAIYGVVWLAMAFMFALRLPWAWTAMLIGAIGTLWFLPFGTLASLIQIVLLLLWRGRF